MLIDFMAFHVSCNREKACVYLKASVSAIVTLRSVIVFCCHKNFQLFVLEHVRLIINW